MDSETLGPQDVISVGSLLGAVLCVVNRISLDASDENVLLCPRLMETNFVS